MDRQAQHGGARSCHDASADAARVRIEALFEDAWSIGDVVAFHTREKYLILAHDEATYRKLGPLVARAKSMDVEGFQADYRQLFRHALDQEPTVGSHTNVLQHLAGFFREAPEEDGVVVRNAINEYRTGVRSLRSTKSVIADAAIRNGYELIVDSTYICDATAGDRG